MESSKTEGWLPDVNVWLALCSDRHVHHKVAAQWLDSVQSPVFFSRATQMGLLRLLTNVRVMEDDVLTPQRAIAVYRELRADERVGFIEEPAEAEEKWLSMMSGPAASGSAWTDAFLAAVAAGGNLRIVSFDGGMKRWPISPPEILAPA
jgi:toxin-antitoxin system PIN domain toxin